MQTMNELEDAWSYTGSFLKFAKKGRGTETRELMKEGVPMQGFESRSSGGTPSISSFSPPKGDLEILEIAEKMKGLGIMDSPDVEYILDLEEALHCYSLLTCPFYLDIVRNFFMEVYSDFAAASKLKHGLDAIISF